MDNIITNGGHVMKNFKIITDPGIPQYQPYRCLPVVDENATLDLYHTLVQGTAKGVSS